MWGAYQHRKSFRGERQRRECCNCEDGNCIVLDDGDTCTCPQMISFSVCCKWFRWAVLPLAGTLEAEIYRDRDLKRCTVCGGVFIQKSNRAKYCPGCAAKVHRRQKTENERKRRSAVDS
ncbi:cysteine-rich VLP domain-containing protein [Longicatena sp. 210702-DFI.1.36]|nr:MULTISPECIES: cysteine-rich VLP domain-containing protein [Longicatena]MCB5393525.1 cysteine-rich VLP domain-containing protein [Longicatena caecimuris]MCB5564480.1 cysteine-rich VLP domain-containing protein [Longicatena caecimuris]MCB6266148.1 cysteine-rich VLP domain-containing protein [Longicatena sp. 210702-DFI.1.160]MCB6316725.1 cysteine-rich VLP domain-containing protein [Longicatena sp. 210702-DFI.1.100]MCB6430576.1 cysteine-rich VLP domain-containing protein [Longicatena sp. 210702